MPLQKERIDWSVPRESLARRNQMAAMEEQSRGEQAMALGQNALNALVSSMSESEAAKRAREAREFQEKLHAMGVNERREEQNATRAYDAKKFSMEQANTQAAKQATNDRLKEMQDSLAEERVYQRGAQAAEQARRAAYDAADYYQRQRAADAAVLNAKAADRRSRRTTTPQSQKDQVLAAYLKSLELEQRGGNAQNSAVAKDVNVGIGADNPPPGASSIENSARGLLAVTESRIGTPSETPQDKVIAAELRRRLGIVAAPTGGPAQPQNAAPALHPDAVDNM